MTSHMQQWQPPPRPEWVQRLNEEGDCMDIRGVVPLDEDSLLDAARRATGLSDFGGDEWCEPFRIFIKSLEEEAELNLMGRLWARDAILILLGNRLQVEDTYKRHPEINDEQIVQPIIVVGQSRCGTSYLFDVLASHPENGATMQWEATFPCPPPEKATYQNDPRILRAHRIIDRWNRVTPTVAGIYEFSGYVPMEDCELLGATFMSNSFMDGIGQVPSYDLWLLKQDIKPALQYHKRILKLLQWKNPRKHWVLKDPMHLDRLPALLQVYPDACFVWPHRDPVHALASVVSLIGTIQWQRSNHPFKGGSFEFVTDPAFSAQRFNAVIDQIEAGIVPGDRIHHLQFRDMVRDPLAAIEGIYRHFGIPFSAEARQAIARYVADHPRDQRPPHKFSPGSPEAIAEARKAYQRYQDYFHIDSE